jgi:hypothetical protein
MTDRIQARYWIETAYPLEVAAATMAGEQSTGTFVRVAGETGDDAEVTHRKTHPEQQDAGDTQASEGDGAIGAPNPKLHTEPVAEVTAGKIAHHAEEERQRGVHTHLARGKVRGRHHPCRKPVVEEPTSPGVETIGSHDEPELSQP